MHRHWRPAGFAVTVAAPGQLTERDPMLLQALKGIVEPATLGDPVRPLLWVSKSLDKLATTLTEMGHAISPNSVRKLLCELGFSRQANRKAEEGSKHRIATPSSTISMPRLWRPKQPISPLFP